MRRSRLLLNKRAEFSKRTKLEGFVRAGGRCEHIDEDGFRCEVKFRPGVSAHYDHVVAASLGGGNGLGNLAVLCKTHHAEKTEKLDIPRAAKTERLRQKHFAGIR